MFNAIKRKVTNYYDNLPTDIPRTVGTSALLSFSVSIMFIKKPDGVIDISRSLFGSAVAATASFIHAIITPIFKELLGSAMDNYFGQFFQAQLVSVLTSALIQAVSKSASLTFPFYSTFSMNFLCSIFVSPFQNTKNSVYLYIA